MSYEKHNFRSGDVITSQSLNEMDEQIAKNENDIAYLKEILMNTNAILFKLLDNLFIGENGELILSNITHVFELLDEEEF